jgi:hypothetical protein
MVPPCILADAGRSRPSRPRSRPNPAGHYGSTECRDAPLFTRVQARQGQFITWAACGLPAFGPRDRGSTPGPSDTTWVGGLQVSQKDSPGHHIKRQKAMCCDSVAMRAISGDQQLKSLRDKKAARAFAPRNCGGGRTGLGHVRLISKKVPRPGPHVTSASGCLAV